MLEQQGNALTFVAFYTESKVGKTGLTVTLDLWEGTNEIVTGGSATEIGDGLYYYTLASGSVDANALYIAVFKTATTTVDQQHIPALWIVGRTWVANVDGTISSRAPSATALSTATWTNTLATNLATIITKITNWALGTDNKVLLSTDAQTGVTIPTVTTVGTLNALAANVITAASIAADAGTEIGTAVWASGTRTLTGFGTLVADIWSYVTRTLTSGGGASAAEVWAYAVRTLTEVLVSTDNTNPANTLTARRGDYYSKSLTDLGNITAYTKLWLDVKETEDGLQPDDDALVQIVVGSGFATTGLIYLNGDTASNNAWGSLTVDDAATADITIVLEADATVLLPPGRYYYGLKALVSGNPTTLVSGVFIVLPGYTTAVS